MSKKVFPQFPIFCLCLAGLFAIMACNTQKKPDNTWERIQKDGLAVGLVNNPPFVKTYTDKIEGTEVELIENFAKKNGLKVRYRKDDVTNLVKRLEQGKLDLVIGGFEKDTPWKTKTTITRPYDREHVLLIPRNENTLLSHLEEFLPTEPEQKSSIMDFMY